MMDAKSKIERLIQVTGIRRLLRLLHMGNLNKNRIFNKLNI